MQSGDEAMVLYDVDVVGLGELLVVEHFTVSDGVIVRLRQIHDTAAIREASGLDGEHDGFRQEMVIAALPLQVFDALTSLEGLTGWWASSARGSGEAGGTFELGFAGLDERLRMHVDVADPTTLVTWTCLEHTVSPDWEGTKIVFSLTNREVDQTTLSFCQIVSCPTSSATDSVTPAGNTFWPACVPSSAGTGKSLRGIRGVRSDGVCTVEASALRPSGTGQISWSDPRIVCEAKQSFRIAVLGDTLASPRWG